MKVDEKSDLNDGKSGDHILKAEEKKLEENKLEDPKESLEAKVNICAESENSTVKTNLSKPEDVKNECNQLEDTLNKRKLEVRDDAEIKMKKPKYENDDKENTKILNGDITSLPSSAMKLVNMKCKDPIDEIEAKVLGTVDSLLTMLGKPNKKIQVNKCALDRLALCFSVQPWKKNYVEAINTVKLLEDKMNYLNSISANYRIKLAETRDFQKTKFDQYNFKAKVSVRTVGVNVKIYRATNIKREVPILPKTESSQDSNKPTNALTVTTATNTGLVPNSSIRDTIVTTTVPASQVARKPLLPRIINQNTRGSQVMTLSSRLPAPNVTVTGTRMITVGRPPPSGVVLVPSNTIASSSTNRFAEMAKDDHKIQKVVTSGISAAQPTAVAKVNVPGMPNNPNVLVPLKDYLQLLPAGSKGATVIQQNVSRPTLIPPLPSSLVGARTVTYIVPQNSALGARGIQPFMPPQNQQVQFVLRVTNPGTVPALNSVVNTVARPAVMQPPLATAPRLQPPMSTTPAPVAQSSQAAPRNSGLILISHTSKHPAPFPRSPHYPDNKGKALPPKPALKGSKNQSGIVLSWNMSLTNKNTATIASYQLFAYQETDGPVDSSLWKKVGDVNALPLPMACTLTQFIDKNRYYFTVRAVDVFQRFGPFSDPVSILFERDGESSKKEKGA